MRRARRNRDEVARLDLAFLAGNAAGGFSFDHVDDLIAAMRVFAIATEVRRNGKHRRLALRGLTEALLNHLAAVATNREDIRDSIVRAFFGADEFVELLREKLLGNHSAAIGLE